MAWLVLLVAIVSTFISRVEGIYLLMQPPWPRLSFLTPMVVYSIKLKFGKCDCNVLSGKLLDPDDYEDSIGSIDCKATYYMTPEVHQGPLSSNSQFFLYYSKRFGQFFLSKIRQCDNASTLEWEYCGKAVSKFHVSSARPVNLTRHSIFKSKRSREVMLSHAYGLPSWTGKSLLTYHPLKLISNPFFYVEQLLLAPGLGFRN